MQQRYSVTVANRSEVIVMAKTAKLKPINSVIWVTEDKCQTITPEQVCMDVVGEKAYGIASLPSQWTLPFFVISGTLLETYKIGRCFDESLRAWKQSVEKAAKLCGISAQDSIIVRSNAQTEGLEERGKYISVGGILADWPALVKHCFDDSIEQAESSNISMPIIVQKRVDPLLRGHVSNERRIAEEKRDWQGEIETALPQLFKISLRKWRKKINVSSYLGSALTCPSSKALKEVLSVPCTWATDCGLRVHFEWIFDGDYIFLVQADEESESTGINPLKRSVMSIERPTRESTIFPRCVHKLSAEDADKYKSYYKIQNPLLYQKLGQNIAPLYILDNENTLSLLAQGIVSQELESDLRVLASQSLIIRTDVDTDDKEERQLLPRTCEIREMDAAVTWLKKNYAELKEKTTNNIIFILHNYIPAFSSAFAYASPKNNIVRMEALWGLPEGLYYYSHDKYIVDTMGEDITTVDPTNFKVEERRNYKKYFVCPMKDGRWEVQSLAMPFDWKASIPEKDWIKEIALVTRRIAEAEQQSISVMWFVGVDHNRYNRHVFPWFHEPYQYNETQMTPRNKLSFERTFITRTLQDVERLENQMQQQGGIIRNVLIQPTDEKILRNRDVIDRIGHAAQLLGANIILEGGILSHAYYQLVRTGAKVEVRNTFGKTQSLEFNKLVRDKIPEKIEKNGEQAVTAQLEKDILIRLLKRKLVEESLEVLDAKDTDDLIAELADVMEVIDSIVKQKGIVFQDILDRKEKKRKKAGGFEKGVYLKKTSNNTEISTGTIVVDSDPVDIRQTIAKSTDLRKYSTANESFTRIKVPVTMDDWEIRPSVKADSIDIVIKGERKQGTLQIEISVFEEANVLF